MQTEPETTTELIPLAPIRVEAGLSRYPVHRLAKHGDIVIDIKELSESGEALIRWEVSHNNKYGQPGPLAYKIDTLIINRRLEEARRPVPKIIRIGSLNDICRELDCAESGKNTNHIKIAFHQNASAYITAKTRYKTVTGTERNIEFGDTRYGVVFTGERLPDGRLADAVYIVLHDFYREILDNAITRPLNYDYLKELPPAPQRFYELLSYQMYAALKHDRARAKLVYSELCTHAPQTRYMEFDSVKKQMYKIHNVHRKSGYIAKIEYQQTTDGEGNPDWIMFYQPGMRARAEFLAFTGRDGTSMPVSVPKAVHTIPEPVQLDLELVPNRKPRRNPAPETATSPLVAMLTQRGVTETIAVELVRQYPERIEAQLEILDWLTEKKPEKITEPAAYLVSAIKNGHATPKGFVSRAERERRAEAKRAKEQQAAEDRRRKQQNAAQADADRKAADAYLKTLGKAERSQLEAKALAAASEETRASYQDAGMARYRDTLMLGMVRDYLGPILRTQQATEA
jgi:hypothetical protein